VRRGRTTAQSSRSEVGTPLDPDNVSHLFSRICRRAGLGYWHLHELRDCGASLMLAQGMDLYVVSEVLGHSSVAITKDGYGHLVESQKRAAAQLMSTYLERDLSVCEEMLAPEYIDHDAPAARLRVQLRRVRTSLRCWRTCLTLLSTSTKSTLMPGWLWFAPPGVARAATAPHSSRRARPNPCHRNRSASRALVCLPAHPSL
jgi:hypothetical protein